MTVQSYLPDDNNPLNLVRCWSSCRSCVLKSELEVSQDCGKLGAIRFIYVKTMNSYDFRQAALSEISFTFMSSSKGKGGVSQLVPCLRRTSTSYFKSINEFIIPFQKWNDSD